MADIKKWLNQRGFKNYKEPESDEDIYYKIN